MLLAKLRKNEWAYFQFEYIIDQLDEFNKTVEIVPKTKISCLDTNVLIESSAFGNFVEFIELGKACFKLKRVKSSKLLGLSFPITPQPKFILCLVMAQNMAFAVKFLIMILIPDVPAPINLAMRRVSLVTLGFSETDPPAKYAFESFPL